MKYDKFIYDKDYIIPDEQVWYTNIISYYDWKWIYVRGKWKDTWELPWWHREEWESILECAKRELYEETWATKFDLYHLCSRKLVEKETWKQHHWYVYIAKINELWDIPESEIDEILWFTEQPQNLTYPFIQADLHKIALDYFWENKDKF
jgi:8-oxo-dGTP diphosphatase